MAASAENGVLLSGANDISAGVLPMSAFAGGVCFQSDHFRQIVEELPTALYMTDADGRITYYNKAAAQFWGRAPQLGEDSWCGCWRLFWPDGRPMAHDECPMAQTLKTGRPVLGARAIAERPDGSRFPFMPFPSPLFDADGKVTGAINMLFDTGPWTEAERAAHHLAAIVESSDDAIVSKDLDGIIQTWNRAAERLLGYTADEIIGKSILTIIPADRHGEETEIISRIRRGESIEHYETIRRRKDGSLIELSLTVSPVRDRHGRVVGASKIARDITERRQAERLKEHLVNEIKHRVKNTLGTVQAMAVQTFRKAPQEERNLFVGRLHALADAHDVLTQRDWTSVSLRDMAKRALKPFVDTKKARLSADGPDADISPNRALLLAMVLHELGTNAVKYGALSNTEGSVNAAWSLEQDNGQRRLKLVWEEEGGPPVSAPTHKGFGSRMIEHAIKGEQGVSEFRFEPKGLICRIEMPV
ncbi:MAG TPA: PAS domain S-box protein [Rhizomicrobium sp.]|nr:PAS domain S-box protein [Rhizomicrobium sp.]